MAVGAAIAFTDMMAWPLLARVDPTGTDPAIAAIPSPLMTALYAAITVIWLRHPGSVLDLVHASDPG